MLPLPPHIHEFGWRPASQREAPAGCGRVLPQHLHHGAILPLPWPARYRGQEGVRRKEKETDKIFDMLSEYRMLKERENCERAKRADSHSELSLQGV